MGTGGNGAEGIIVITYTPMSSGTARPSMVEIWGGFFRQMGGSLIIGPVMTSSGATYTGPGNIVSGAVAWWGLRAYDAATAGTKAANICRASDSTCEDIDTLSNGKFDTATAASFCASTTCSVKTLYDQTGNGHNLTQSTLSLQPALTFNCLGSLPCMTFTAANDEYLEASQFLTAQPFSLSSVSQETGDTSDGGAVLVDMSGYNAGDGYWDVPDVWSMGVANSETNTITDNVTHAVEDVFNRTSSATYIDGTFNADGDVGAGSIGTGGLTMGGTAAYLQGDITEVGLWPVAFTSTQAGNMNSNQHSYWGF